jgi:preprotein translocase subunit SecG
MTFLHYLLMILLFLTATFLIVLVLIQRGKGGGLAGAFGGMGGQSAFGTKAGDLFTKITIVTAIFWGVLCVVSLKVFAGLNERISSDSGTSAPASAPASTEHSSDTTPEQTPVGK